MTSAFIGALLALLFANFFILLFIRKFIAKINKQVRTYYVKQLEIFDHLVDKKEEQLKTISPLNKEEPVEHVEPSQIVIATYEIPELIQPARYIDSQLLEVFKLIENDFNYDYNAILNHFLETFINNDNKSYYLDIKSLLNQLDDEKIYSLFLLSIKKQRQALIELDAHFIEWIDNYEQVSRFDLNKFLIYLNHKLSEFDSQVHVFTSEILTVEHQDIVYHEDRTIYKGICIIYQNKVYDYSI